ncbi:MAG: M20 family metallo-hydrolase [Hyphomicrobiaceae bacterium]
MNMPGAKKSEIINSSAGSDGVKATFASDYVRETRLWQRHMEIARFGATAKGGKNAQALTHEDGLGRALFARWAEQLGFSVFIDPIGNMFVRREGTAKGSPPVLTGSHLDTQPTGGKFDGIFGVLAGLEALQAIEEADLHTQRPIEVVCWTNEEGTRFMPALMGSNAFMDPASIEHTLAIKDASGVTVREAVEDIMRLVPNAMPRPLGFDVACFLEAHIEQGPILEREHKTIGIVTGIQGWRRFLVEVRGEEGHAGTLPSRSRKDALLAAARMVTALELLMRDPEDTNDTIRFTVGRFVVTPGAPAVIPGHVLFTIDFRNPNEDVLARIGDQIELTIQAQVGDCSVTVTETSRTSPISFNGRVLHAALAATQRLGIEHMTMYSGAGHDAQNMHKLCDSAMIFIPCEKGISHNEAENATPADLAAGARVLADTLVDLAGRA